MKQLYFCKEFDSEWAWDLKNLKRRASLMGLKQITVTKAVPIKDNDIFFCKHFELATSKSDETCGRSCEGYQPRNGIKGMCRHQGRCYESEGEDIIINLTEKTN